MGLLSSAVLQILGYGIGIPLGLLVGFYLFIYSQPVDVKDPVVKPLHEMDMTEIRKLFLELPLWIKSPDFERVDWLNKFVFYMWPYLDKAICGTIRSMSVPIFEEYIGQYQIESIDFKNLSLGSLPPIIHGMKVLETNERELVMELACKWAANSNIILELQMFSWKIPIQLVDLQVSSSVRVTLKPLVPTFPCFSTIVVSLMDEPQVDFGMAVLGLDIMSIPFLYRFIQNTIEKKVAELCLWPRTLEIPILDASIVAKKPVGILHVKVVRAIKLLKMDLLGLSDPYVKLKLSGERLPARKTTIKKKTLNPVWNENFKLIVKDPQSQILNLIVYDWDKVGGHDKLGAQVVPLKLLTANETKQFTLDLLKNTNISEHQTKKPRGQIELEMTYVPFREDSEEFSGIQAGSGRKESGLDKSFGRESPTGAGLLLVTVHGAENVEGERHNNPYAQVLFRGDMKKTKMMRRTRDPLWNDDFQFVLEEPPMNDKIRIEVLSRRTVLGFRSKESLGHVEIKLADVVHNGRLNHKYHLIDSKKGVIHVELSWKTI